MIEERAHEFGGELLPKQTFDQVARLYDEMRPSYPEAVFDDVVALSGVGASSRLLEIGCGTGHATRAFAVRGLQIDCVELGENMAAVARENLQDFDRVTIEVANFDEWTAGSRYDLVYSASAYHWLNPATREQRIAALLNVGGSRGGWLAVWRNRHVRNGSSEQFVRAAQEIYEREAPALVKKRIGLPTADEVAQSEEEEFTSGLFDALETRVYLWQKSYAAREYVRMMDTHSDHRLLPTDRRERLLSSLEHLINAELAGSVTKDYATILQLARKRG